MRGGQRPGAGWWEEDWKGPAKPFDLNDGSGIAFDDFKVLYTPSGRSIQNPYDDEEEYSQDILSRYKKGEFFHADRYSFQWHSEAYHKKWKKLCMVVAVLCRIISFRSTPHTKQSLPEWTVPTTAIYEYAFKYAEKHKKELEDSGFW